MKCLFASLVMSLVIVFYSPKGSQEIMGIIALCVGIYFLVLWSLKGIEKDEVKFMKNMLHRDA